MVEHLAQKKKTWFDSDTENGTYMISDLSSIPGGCCSLNPQVEVELVLANGELVKANANEHEDLFWAIRGGGLPFFFWGELGYPLGGDTFWKAKKSSDFPSSKL